MSAEDALGRPDLPIRMLLIEDCQHDAEFVSRMLERSPEIVVDINHVCSLSEAVAAIHQEQYDILLLDLGLPDSCGTDSVLRLRTCAPNTPVVVLTGDDRNGTAIAAINAGAQDYVPKQHLVGQLLARMMKHSIARHHRLIQAQSEALIDNLTGVANRRACDAELERRLSDFERHNYPFCVALLDIDYFKQVNDRWGHEAGDQAIQAVAKVVTNSSRKSDHVARYGGEEFAVILPMTPLQGGKIVIERCRQGVSKMVVGEQEFGITISAGAAEIQKGEDGRSLFARADEALYAAKRSGRNRCMYHLDGAPTDFVDDCVAVEDR